MNRKMPFLIALLALVLPARADYRYIHAPLDTAEWASDGDRLQCVLTHVIPGFGQVDFLRRPKHGLIFRVQVLRGPKRSGTARLMSLPPEWKHHTHPRNLGTVPVVPGKTPFYLNNGWARRLLAELEIGMTPVLRYRDWADSSDIVELRVSSLRFGEAWSRFQHCEQNLLGYDFADVRHTVFQYAFGQTGLDGPMRARLDQIAEYLQLDPSVKRVRIDGWTDSKGFARINLKVARKRAEAVRDYLVGKGLPAAMFQIVPHHEKDVKFSNRTREGRNRNRRVEITLMKG